MEIGQQLRVKLYFSAGTDLESVECFVEVVWVDIHLGESWEIIGRESSFWTFRPRT